MHFNVNGMPQSARFPENFHITFESINWHGQCPIKIKEDQIFQESLILHSRLVPSKE